MSESELSAGRAALPLSQDAYDFYSHVQAQATSTAKLIYDSWQRPKRHNLRVERTALWHALDLDQSCAWVLEPGNTQILIPPLGNVETCYDIQAGVRSVHATFPLSAEEREELSTKPEEQKNQWLEGEAPVDASRLLERWHAWLWNDSHGGQRSHIEALGASAIFVEASARLSRTIPRLLGWE